MAPRVFINFRGTDQAGYAALLDRELSMEFGSDVVFRASRSIEPGQDFVEALLAQLAVSSVLLAVIGPDWVRHLGADPGNDWVRREIRAALRLGIPVIPILVEDAAMPQEGQLPADVAPLSRCQYLRLHHRNIAYDLARIVAVVAQRIHLPAAHGTDDEAPQAAHALRRVSGSTCHIGVIAGSILHVRNAGIWVNSENTDMEMSRHNEFTMSGIIRYWGARRDAKGAVVDDVVARELSELVGQRRPIAPGGVIVTGPGALAESHGVRHIMHVAAVQGEPGAGFRQIRDVGSAVSTILSEAERLAEVDEATRSIVIPILGVGTGGGSLPSTTRSMVRAVTDYVMYRPNSLLKIIYLLGYRKSELATILDCMAADSRLITVPADDPPAGV